MLLLIFWGLITLLAFVLSDCAIGTREVDDFDCTEAGVRVVTGFFREAALKISAWFYILFMFPCTKIQYSI